MSDEAAPDPARLLQLHVSPQQLPLTGIHTAILIY
eukprot:COSAG06_NODE_58950_length_275_cov_1.267045_1_plen_34_part_10